MQKLPCVSTAFFELLSGPKDCLPVVWGGRKPRMIQIRTLLITDFNTSHRALQGKAKIHCERGHVWLWDQEKKDLLRLFSVLWWAAWWLDTEFTRDLFLWREKHNDSMPAAYIKRSLVCKVCQGHVCVTLWELQLWGSMSWYILLHISLFFLFIFYWAYQLVSLISISLCRND